VARVGHQLTAEDTVPQRRLVKLKNSNKQVCLERLSDLTVHPPNCESQKCRRQNLCKYWLIELSSTQQSMSFKCEVENVTIMKMILQISSCSWFGRDQWFPGYPKDWVWDWSSLWCE
jgi:hypothetical protein